LYGNTPSLHVGSRQKPRKTVRIDGFRSEHKFGTSRMECGSTHKQYTWYYGRWCAACFKKSAPEFDWCLQWNWRQNMPFPNWNRTLWLMNMREYALQLCYPVLHFTWICKDVIMVTIQDLHVYVYLGRDRTRLRAHVTILRNVQVEWTVPMRLSSSYTRLEWSQLSGHTVLCSYTLEVWIICQAVKRLDTGYKSGISLWQWEMFCSFVRRPRPALGSTHGSYPTRTSGCLMGENATSNTHTALFTQYLRPGRSGESWNWVYRWLTAYVYRRKYSWNPNSNTLEPDLLQRDRPAACYCPAVFFRHIHLTALSFPLGKFRRAFQTLVHFDFFFFKKIACLELHNLRLRKSGRVCV
jgi:hypothetical protein